MEWSAIGSADMFPHPPVPGEYDEFSADLAKMVPGLGEGGDPVVLTGAEAQAAEEGMKTEAFNLIVSDKISYTR